MSTRIRAIGLNPDTIWRAGIIDRQADAPPRSKTEEELLGWWRTEGLASRKAPEEYDVATAWYDWPIFEKKRDYEMLLFTKDNLDWACFPAVCVKEWLLRFEIVRPINVTIAMYF